MNPVRTSFSFSLSLLLVAGSIALAQSSPAFSSQPGESLYLKVQIDNKLMLSALKPGDVVQGKLSQPVYAGDREIFATGSDVRMMVDHMEQRRRAQNDHWPWVVQVLTPRHVKSPVFEQASVTSDKGTSMPLRVSVVSIGREREIRAKGIGSAGQTQNAEQSRAVLKNSAPILTLEASSESPTGNSGTHESLSGSSGVTVTAGTEAKVILLGDVSASRSHAGDSVRAQLIEPVWMGSKIILPAGSLLEGTISKTTAPRMLSRAGSLLMTFNRLTVPGGSSGPIAASLVGVDLNQSSHTSIDPEGGMKGEHPGKAWMLIHAGVTGGIAKVADDGTQLLIEAIVSTATDASTAGSARIAALCLSGIFMLTRHGRDVVLPKFTQMRIMFDRPVSLPASPAAQAQTPDFGAQLTTAVPTQ